MGHRLMVYGLCMGGAREGLAGASAPIVSGKSDVN